MVTFSQKTFRRTAITDGMIWIVDLIKKLFFLTSRFDVSLIVVDLFEFSVNLDITHAPYESSV